ncbi:MAG: TRAP transporter large permease subunit [Myxococcales bacterium]|nr:TRAP transporter large permease subunit [Myxococcales bacterium]
MNPINALLSAVGLLFRAVDLVTTDLWRAIRNGVRDLLKGPLQGVAFYLILTFTGVLLLLEDVLSTADRVIGWLERAFVTVAMAAMAFLAFNEYMARELRPSFGDMGGLWALEGQMNVALLLMVVVGFLGASLATQERKHIAVDAIGRVLSPGPARLVKRFVALASMGLCLIFAQGSWNAVFSHAQDAFEGASVWSPLQQPINAVAAWMPGERYGPPSCHVDGEPTPSGCPTVTYASGDDWIDAQYDQGLDPFELHFEDVKLSVVNPSQQPVELTLVLEEASGEDAEDVTVQVTAPADGQSEFRSVEVTEAKRIALRVDAGSVQPGEVLLEPGLLNVVTVSPRGPPTVERSVHAAFGYVDAGDRFPLWIPLLLLVFAFGMMALRFLGHVFVPFDADADQPTPRPGTRRPADVILAGAFPGALIAIGLGVWLGQGWIILLASLLLVFLGAPLFVAVGVGTLASWMLLRNGNAETVVSDMFEATKKQELLAIPFFVLAGNLMTRGSIATRLIEVARALIGGVPGGLGAGAVAACALFAAISGSSPVTVIAIGSIMFPMLLREGYSERYGMGVLTTAGGLGIIIPPSIPMIVYAIMVSGHPAVGVVDPATLFKAGILPGLFIAFALVSYTFFVHWPRDVSDTSTKDRPVGPLLAGWATDVLTTGLRGLPSLFLPILILGGIYGWLDFGVFAIQFTVTEAAAVAVVYALFVELVVHRELRIRDLPSVFSDSAVMMGSLFLILVIAISLNRFFVFEQVPEMATEWMLARVSTPLGFLIMVNLFLLALGCVMDILSAILIVAPLLAPIAASYGIHPVHFGIMFIVNLELGYLTPPMGINLFVASTVFEKPILEVIRAVIPFLLIMLFCLVVIVWVPWLSLALITP